MYLQKTTWKDTESFGVEILSFDSTTRIYFRVTFWTFEAEVDSFDFLNVLLETYCKQTVAKDDKKTPTIFQ